MPNGQQREPFPGETTLVAIPLNIPGFMGLDKQAKQAVIGPEWATVSTNTVIDDANRLSTRKGFTPVTNTALPSQIRRLAIFETATGAEEVIATTDTAVFKSADSGNTFTDVTDTVVFSDGNWQFQMFKNLLIGVQQGHVPIQYDGISFSDLNPSGVPSGGVMLSAFGRLWIVDSDKQTIKYSGLLAETDWTSTDSGSIGIGNIWKGTDTIKALAEFNGALVVFGEKNILFFREGFTKDNFASGPLGVDPTTLRIDDLIPGIGCIARDSVVGVDGDLWFLSNSGLISLQRLLVQKSNPLDNLSQRIHDFLAVKIETADKDEVQAIYSPANRFYLLSLTRNVAGVETGRVVIFDTREKLQDGSVRVIGEWSLVPSAVVVESSTSDILMARVADLGIVGKYAGNTDNADDYAFDYESGWLSIEPTRLKLVKRLSGLFRTREALTITYKWAFDFSTVFKTAFLPIPNVGQDAEWGSSEWALAEWSGGFGIGEKGTAGKGKGQYIKVGISVPNNNFGFSVQQLKLFAKIGRLA